MFRLIICCKKLLKHLQIFIGCFAYNNLLDEIKVLIGSLPIRLKGVMIIDCVKMSDCFAGSLDCFESKALSLNKCLEFLIKNNNKKVRFKPI